MSARVLSEGDLCTVRATQVSSSFGNRCGVRPRFGRLCSRASGERPFLSCGSPFEPGPGHSLPRASPVSQAWCLHLFASSQMSCRGATYGASGFVTKPSFSLIPVPLGRLRVGGGVLGVCGNLVRWLCSVAVLVTSASPARPFVTKADAATCFR